MVLMPLSKQKKQTIQASIKHSVMSHLGCPRLSMPVLMDNALPLQQTSQLLFGLFYVVYAHCNKQVSYYLGCSMLSMPIATNKSIITWAVLVCLCPLQQTTRCHLDCLSLSMSILMNNSLPGCKKYNHTICGYTKNSRTSSSLTYVSKIL